MNFFNIKTLIKLAMTLASCPHEHWPFDFAYKCLFNVENVVNINLILHGNTNKKIRQQNIQFTDLLIDYI